MAAIVLNLKPFVDLSDEQFYQLCQNHRDLKFQQVDGEEVLPGFMFDLSVLWGSPGEEAQ